MIGAILFAAAAGIGSAGGLGYDPGVSPPLEGFLEVRGRVMPDGAIEVGPLFTDTRPRWPVPEGGEYSLLFLDSAGRRLREYSFGTKPMRVTRINGQDRLIDSGMFSFSVPFDVRNNPDDFLPMAGVFNFVPKVTWATDTPDTHNIHLDIVRGAVPVAKP